MNQIVKNRFRPVLITIFWCYFLFKGINIDPYDSDYTSEIFLLILLLIMLAFRIRETIAIKQDSLVFDLQKNHNIIDLKAIDEIIFNDCFNIVKIKTKDSSTTINIGQFQSKKVERFFKENNLYFDEPKEI